MKVRFLLVAALGFSNALRLPLPDEAVTEKKPDAVLAMYHTHKVHAAHPKRNSDYHKMVKCWLDNYKNHQSSNHELQFTTFDENSTKLIEDYMEANPDLKVRRTDAPIKVVPNPNEHFETHASHEYMRSIFPITANLLREGRDTLHSDLDAIWVRDPMPEILKLKAAQPDWDVISSTQGCMAPADRKAFTRAYNVGSDNSGARALRVESEDPRALRIESEDDSDNQDGLGYDVEGFGINIGFIMFRSTQKNIDRLELLGKTANGRPYQAWDQKALEFEYKKDCTWHDIHGNPLQNVPQTCDMPAEGIMAVCGQDNTKILFLNEKAVHRPNRATENAKPTIDLKDPDILVAHPMLAFPINGAQRALGSYGLLREKAPGVCTASE